MPFRFECKTCDMKFQVQADYQKHIQKCGSMFTEMTPNELNPKSRSKKKKLPKTEGWFLIHQNRLIFGHFKNSKRNFKFNSSRFCFNRGIWPK